MKITNFLKSQFAILFIVSMMFSGSQLAAESKTATIDIKGMTCHGCANAVKGLLEKIEGVSSANVTIGKALVSADTNKVTEGQLRQAVREAGFTVTLFSWD